MSKAKQDAHKPKYTVPHEMLMKRSDVGHF